MSRAGWLSFFSKTCKGPSCSEGLHGGEDLSMGDLFDGKGWDWGVKGTRNALLPKISVLKTQAQLQPRIGHCQCGSLCYSYKDPYSSVKESSAGHYLLA